FISVFNVPPNTVHSKKNSVHILPTSFRTESDCPLAHAVEHVTNLNATPLVISSSVSFTPNGTSFGEVCGFADAVSGNGIPSFLIKALIFLTWDSHIFTTSLSISITSSSVVVLNPISSYRKNSSNKVKYDHISPTSNTCKGDLG